MMLQNATSGIYIHGDDAEGEGKVQAPAGPPDLGHTNAL